MPDGFTIGTALSEPTIFECPHCKETIDASAEACRFCGAKIDHEAARTAAALMAKINQACSDASYMRSTALSLPVFLLLRFVPFIAIVGTIGFVGVTLITPFWALRWWLKYGAIKTDDADFRRARSTVRWIGIVVSCLFVVLVAANIVVFLLPVPHN
jgi:hypothetical protein